MADRTRRSPRLLVGGIAVVVLAAAALFVGFGGERRPDTPPQAPPTVQRPEGVLEPVLEFGVPVGQPITGQAATTATEPAAPVPADKPSRKSRRARQRKSKAAPAPQQESVPVTEDGRIDYRKMPPMGG